MKLENYIGREVQIHTKDYFVISAVLEEIDDRGFTFKITQTNEKIFQKGKMLFIPNSQAFMLQASPLNKSIKEDNADVENIKKILDKAISDLVFVNVGNIIRGKEKLEDIIVRLSKYTTQVCRGNLTFTPKGREYIDKVSFAASKLKDKLISQGITEINYDKGIIIGADISEIHGLVTNLDIEMYLSK